MCNTAGEYQGLAVAFGKGNHDSTVPQNSKDYGSVMVIKLCENFHFLEPRIETLLRLRAT